jgi:hypothetical protein
MKKKVKELEIENFNYQHELLNLHKHLIKIDKTLGSIDSKWVKFKEVGIGQLKGGGVDYDPYRNIEGIKAEGGAHRPLPPSDGGIRQLKDGAFLHEGRTSNLS